MIFSKMFLLPLFTGILLVLQGPESHVLAARNSGAAKDIDEYMKYLDELSLLKKIIQTQNKRQKEQTNIDEPHVAWSDVDNKALGEGVNFAADDTSENDVPASDVETESKDKGGTSLKTDTTSKDPTKATHEPPKQPEKLKAEKTDSHDLVIKKDSFIFLTIVSACSVAGLVGLIMAGVCWYKLHKRVKAASDVDYPAYGVTGPTKERLPSPGDRKLAQSAQMYHYQHQKQQMIAMEKANGEMKHDASEDDSEEENEEGDYTVYECPGLAPTGEMEVRNPLFTEDAQTPVNGQTTAVNGLPDDQQQK